MIVSQFERVYKIDQLLHQHGVVSQASFLEKLEISAATFKRDLEYMRSRFNAPIEWSREKNGYHYVAPSIGPRFELPGMWLSEEEIYALLCIQNLLKGLSAGVLASQVQPLAKRLTEMLQNGAHSPLDIEQRLRFLQPAKRTLQNQCFEQIANATLGRHQLEISYYTKSTDKTSTRVISPQLLTYYRDNWYADSFCHQADAFRRFALDSIRSVKKLETPAENFTPQEVLDALGNGYGVFAGNASQTARLKFSKARARWVASEQWHPAQIGTTLPDGSYLLELPYADHRELVMDILKYGAGVEVLAPDSLKAAVWEEIQQMTALYMSTDSVARFSY